MQGLPADCSNSAIGLYSRTRFAPSGHDDSAAWELRGAVGELHRTLGVFRRQLPGAVADDPDALVIYGTLLAQAYRLVDQLVHD